MSEMSTLVFMPFLPLYCFGLATVCFFLMATCWVKQSSLAVITVLRFFFNENLRLYPQRWANLCMFMSQSTALTASASRLASNFSLVGQLSLIILTILFASSFGGRQPGGPISDSLGFPFTCLTLFIFFLCFVLLFKENHRTLAFWCGLLFILEGFLLIAFAVDNVLVFYVSFEATLMPMYLLIGAWGSRARKIKANYYFFLYTLAGSLMTLLGLLLLCYGFGSFSYAALVSFASSSDVNILSFGTPLCHVTWLLLAIGFLFKLPMFVFHLWLPEAHVEAPTIGSIILAALLLKLGVYGFVRLPFVLLPHSTVFWLPFLLPFVVAGLVYPAAVAVVQDDIKKVIAYSSVSHMALVLLGLLSQTREGVVGALFLSVGHGIVSGGLFACAGMLYDRYQTRDTKYFSGLAGSMPFFSVFFVLLFLGNTGFPFLCNFPGELLIMLGAFERFGPLVPFLGLGFFLTAAYSFRLINLILFGARKPSFLSNYYDIGRNEYLVLAIFCGAAVVLGIMCSPLIALFENFFFTVLSSM